MSIASEITRINGNIAAAYTALDGKGATLPAAGSQNSANLADTIDTITTGGGSGGGSAYGAVKNIIDDITLPYTFGNAIDDGWYVCTYYQNSSRLTTNFLKNNSQSQSLLGIVFDNSFDAKIYVGGCKAIKVSDDTIVVDVTQTTTSSGTTFEIDFSNASEKWLIIEWNNCNSPNSSYGNADYSITISNSDLTIQAKQNALACIEFLKIRHLYSSYTENNPFVVYTGSTIQAGILGDVISLSPVLKDIELSNNFELRIGSSSSNPDNISWSTHNNIPSTIMPISKVFNLKNFMDKYYKGVTYGVTQLTSTVTSNIITKSSANGAFARIRSFPFILDCSGFTAGSFTWYIASAGDYYVNSELYHYSAPYELFIIAPDNNVQWGGDKIGYTGTPDTPISLTSLKFFANHAPTVSGRTFKIGKANYKMFTEQAATELATLTSKGWTVTE